MRLTAIRTAALLGSALSGTLPAYAQTAAAPVDQASQTAAPQPAAPRPATPEATTAQPTTAQSTAAPAAPVASAPAPAGATDIIVTAQRRSEHLERTPVAVSVVSGDRLISAGITSQADLPTAVPGLSVQAGTSSNNINYVVRGQSTDPYSNTRPGVLPYFNEVQISGVGGSTGFYDLDSVQVLKGPQGTLFGRNSTGGAVLLTTAKPTNSFGGYLAGSVGNYDSQHIEGAVNVPIVDDKVLVRVAGFYERRGRGFQYNSYRDERVGTENRFGLRGSLTLKPVEGVKNELVVDYFHANEKSLAAVLYNADPSISAPVPSTVFYSPALDTAVGVPGAWAAYLAAHPNANPGGLVAALQAQRANGPFNFASPFPDYYRAKNLIISNVTTFDVGTDTTIKNVLGYGKLIFDNANDPFGAPYVVDSSVQASTYEQISEEPQLQGKLGDLNYTIGGFFSHEKNNNFFDSDVLDVSPIIPVTQQVDHWLIKNTTFAAYAQGTYDLSTMTGIRGLALTLGGRYTGEKVGLTILPDDVHMLRSRPIPVSGSIRARPSGISAGRLASRTSSTATRWSIRRSGAPIAMAALTG